MGLRARLISLTVLFSVAGLVGLPWSRNTTERWDGSAGITDLAIDGWQGVDLPSDRDMEAVLQANSTLFRQFRSAEGYEISVYAAYYNSLKGAALSHSPQVCYLGQGWITSQIDKLSLDTRETALRTNQLVAKKGDKKQLVYFWYQTNAGSYADRYRMKLSLLPAKILGRDQSSLFVRVAIQLRGPEFHHERAVLDAFSKKLYSALHKRFFVQNTVSVEGHPPWEGTSSRPNEKGYPAS